MSSGGRSRAVTLIAGLYLLVGAYGVVTGWLMLGAVGDALRGPGARETLAAAANEQGLTGLERWHFQNPDTVAFGQFVVSLGILFAAIGLLRRKQWGRRLMLGLMTLALLNGAWALWNLGRLGSEKQAASARITLIAFQAISLVWCTWVVWRLSGSRARDEFVPGAIGRV